MNYLSPAAESRDTVVHIDKQPDFSLKQSLGDQAPKDSLGWRLQESPEKTPPCLAGPHLH